MIITKALLEIIKEHEGFSHTPYKDSAGLLTIGYGHLMEEGRHNGNGKKVTRISDHKIEAVTKAEAEAILVEDVKIIVRPINKLVKDLDLSQNELDAIISFVYNIGIGAFEKSTMLKKLKAGDKAGAAKEFLRWNKATVNGKKVVVKGLTNRREKEMKLFLGE